MKVSIIILHYKYIQDTFDCLRSIGTLKFNQNQIGVLFIDNDEKPTLNDHLSELAKLHKNITILIPTKNLGFAKGVNMGLKKALEDKKTEYFLILNNDTELPGNALAKLIQYDADIVSPVLKFRSTQGKWVYDYGGKINWWTGRTTHVESTNKPIIPASPAGRQLTNNPIKHDLDYVSGCCMMVKRKALETVGLFDERFFFYFEDVDFCLRAKKNGFKIGIDREVIVYHKLGRSIGRWSKKAIMYNLISNYKFIRKNLGVRQVTGLIYLLLLTLKIIYNRLFKHI